IPSVALVPMAVLVMGTGLTTKVFLVAFAAFWPILVQTVHGVQDVDPVARDTARAFRLRRLDRLWLVTVRGTLPHIATGLGISIPSVALVPMAVLVMGTGLTTKVFLVAFAAFWPILVQTVHGVQDVDPVARDTARAFRLRRLDRLWLVTVRGTLPHIATGLRI